MSRLQHHQDITLTFLLFCMDPPGLMGWWPVTMVKTPWWCFLPRGFSAQLLDVRHSAPWIENF